VALALGLLAGCKVGPNYERPPAPTPGAFKELAGWRPSDPQDTIDRGAWWSVYRDPVLDRLERQVEISNQTLKQAEAAFREAQAVVREARASLFPTLSTTTGVQRQGVGSVKTGSFSADGSVSGGHGSTVVVSDRFSLQGQASWDLDVWGRIRRSVESDVANAQASAADLASARLSAQGELAADYFQLRSLDAQQRLFASTIEQYRRALQIAQNQYNAGIVARSDVVTALTQLQTTQAQAVDLGVRRAQLEHAIAVLTGAPPADLTLAAGPLAARVPVVPASLPSALLERRPDIAAAERRMQQQNALIGVAVAAYYPDISLSAALSFASDALSSLFQTSGEVWTLAASATQTVFQGGLRGAQVEAARAAYDQRVAAYRQTVLGAFQEVEDQLAALRILQEEAKAEDAAVRSAREAVQLTLNEYRAGTVAFTTVITAQTTLLTDERAALTVQEARLVASATLIQALGGGWDATRLPAARSR